MPNKKEPEFTVTDRRRFSEEGEAQTPAAQTEPAQTELENQAKASPRPAATATGTAERPPAPPKTDTPPPDVPSDAERVAGHRAYQQSTDALDQQLRGELGSEAVADEFKISFERILEPFYVTAMMQLGLMGQEGPQRRVDIIGARQTIDTLSYLQEKTKGNLTTVEADLLENLLYQLRMQYLEITNALARAVQNPGSGANVSPS